MRNNKDFDYFKAFVDLSSYSIKAIDLLRETLQKFDRNDIEKKVVEMHEIEHSADLERHELMNRLVKEFLPPIEREDIISIADKIDNVTDSIEDILLNIDIFNVENLRPEIFKFIKVITDCCKSMNSALVEFEHFKRSKELHSLIIEVNRLEEEGDALYINGVRSLYKSTKDPVELMVWTEVYGRLEKCCDACEDVANDIENVVMKNS